LSDAAAGIEQYTASQHTTEPIRKIKDIPLETKSYTDVIIPQKFQRTIADQQFLLLMRPMTRRTKAYMRESVDVDMSVNHITSIY
jgi:hypothetical protein